MKAKTVVELAEMEVTDALIAKAKETFTSKGGGVTVEFLADGKPIKVPSVSVVFEWGAK